MYVQMEFDWDEANVAHIARVGITPGECERKTG